MIFVLKNNNSNSNSKTSMIALIFLQVSLGYDFGCFEFKNVTIKYFVKFFYFLQSMLLSFSSIAAVYYKTNAAGLLWMSAGRIQYMCYVIVINFFRSNTTLSRFQNDLNCIDFALNSNEANRSVRKWKTVVFILFSIHRLIVSTYFYISIGLFMKSVWCAIISYIVNISSDFIIFCNIFMFYSIYYRLNLLTKKAFRMNSIHDVVILRQQYRLIIDVAEKYKRLFDPIYLVTLIFNIFNIMMSVYNVVSGVGLNGVRNEGIDAWHFKYASVKRLYEVLMSLFIIFAPAYGAQKLSSNAQNLRLHLYEKLLDEKIKIKSRQIDLFIRYVEARPFKFAAYQLIPLDANLVIMVLNFCVTYLIVIIQFTHLY